MSLETLLEAARFIELQENAAANQQQQPSPPSPPQPTRTSPNPSLPTLIPTRPITIHLQQQQTLSTLSSPPLQQNYHHSNGTAATCIIPCLPGVGGIAGGGGAVGVTQQQQHVITSSPPNATTITLSGGSVAANGSIVGTTRNIILTATPLPLRIKQVDQSGKQQIAPLNNHSGNTASIPVHSIINNSFDIINPLVFDDQGGARRKQPPLVFRSGTREVHNKLEKHRRAHLKECFDFLKKQLPTSDEKKTSNLSILHSALRHIKVLQKAEHDSEQERERLENERLLQLQRLTNLKNEFTAVYGDNIDLTKILDNIVNPDLATNKPVLNGNIVVKSDEVVVRSNNVLQRSAATSTPPATSLATLAISGTPPAKQDATTVTINGIKEGLSGATFVPMAYPVSGAPLLLQKVTIVPKSTPISFTAQTPNGNSAPQSVNKMLPLMANAAATKYVMKPVVVVSTPSRSS